jgi:hypothetical protein
MQSFKMSKIFIKITADDCSACRAYEPVWNASVKTTLEKHCKILEIKLGNKGEFWNHVKNKSVPDNIKKLFPREEIIGLVQWFPFFVLLHGGIMADPDLPFSCKIFNGSILENGQPAMVHQSKYKEANSDNLVEFVNSDEPFSKLTKKPKEITVKKIPPSAYDKKATVKNELKIENYEYKRRLPDGSILEPYDIERSNY